MARATEIPGLIGITEETVEGGGARFIFEIEDDKEEQFFSAFGLAPGDSEGFQRVVIEALEAMLERMGGKE
jgi:hypothetical protein